MCVLTLVSLVTQGGKMFVARFDVALHILNRFMYHKRVTAPAATRSAANTVAHTETAFV